MLNVCHCGGGEKVYLNIRKGGREREREGRIEITKRRGRAGQAEREFEWVRFGMNEFLNSIDDSENRPSPYPPLIRKNGGTQIADQLNVAQ